MAAGTGHEGTNAKHDGHAFSDSGGRSRNYPLVKRPGVRCGVVPKSPHALPGTASGRVGVPPPCAPTRAGPGAVLTAAKPREGLRAMMELGLIAWVVCSLPAAMLLGYCALGEE
jgi:hypothetical protein